MSQKLSIIVPVYNAEKTLEKCVNSILNQKYSNIEVILINDGSKDDSLKICKKMESKDSRIKIIDIVNQGVSVARNKGIEKSTGDYIAFVDADDYLDENIYEKMLSVAKKYKLDIVFCNYKEIYKDGNKSCIDQLSSIGKSIEPSYKFIERLLSISEDCLSGSCWRSIFTKNKILNNNIKFDEKLTIAEDLKFLLEYLKTTKDVGICDEYLYYFYVNNMSTTSKYMKNQDKDMESVNQWILEYIKSYSEKVDLSVKVKICIANTLIVNTSNVCKYLSPYSFFERIRYIKTKRKSPYYYEALKTAFNNKDLVIKKRWIQMALLYLNLDLILILYYSIKYKNFKRYCN